MKLKTTKKWWQFWIPQYVDIQEALIRDAQLSITTDAINNTSILGGRILKTKSSQYTPDNNIQGGRVVRTMPRELRKIKEGQEDVKE